MRTTSPPSFSLLRSSPASLPRSLAHHSKLPLDLEPVSRFIEKKKDILEAFFRSARSVCTYMNAADDVHVFHFKIRGRRCSVYSHAVVRSAPTHAAIQLNLRVFDGTLLSNQDLLACFTSACGDDDATRTRDPVAAAVPPVVRPF